MKNHHALALTICGAVSPLFSFAAAPVDGAVADQVAVTSLAQLPSQVQVLLGSGRPGNDGIADAGHRFSPLDAIVDNGDAMRRLVHASVGSDSAVVEVERGGRAHWFETIQFSRTGDDWAVVDRRYSERGAE